ncbi:unnamed protein product [Scytosiphon promiscuus]
MGISKIITAVALGFSLLLNQASHAVACTCFVNDYTPCDYVRGDIVSADIIVRAVVLTKSTQSSINDDITITVDVTKVYSGCHVHEITFITGGNSAACGVNLTIGEEYILGLYPAVGNPLDPTAEDVSGLLTVGACNLVSLWSSVPADEKADLAAGC